MSDRPQLSYLEGDGFKVEKFSDFHYRVASRFDIMPNNRNARWAWHDIVTQKRGYLYMGEFRKFVPDYFKRHPRAETLPIVGAEKGWWNCGIEGCHVKLRDDGTSASARKQLEHLEQHK